MVTHRTFPTGTRAVQSNSGKQSGVVRRESNGVCGDPARRHTGELSPPATSTTDTVHPMASGCTLATPVSDASESAGGAPNFMNVKSPAKLGF